MLLVTLTGWINRHQQHVIEYHDFCRILQSAGMRIVLMHYPGAECQRLCQALHALESGRSASTA